MQRNHPYPKNKARIRKIHRVEAKKVMVDDKAAHRGILRVV
jgi:hypothetical protein